MGFLADIFGGGVVKSVESIAKEWIDTPGEKAEAEALMIKTLDPNGLMRRDVSATMMGLFKLYFLIMIVLLLLQAFGVGDLEGLKVAIESMKALFVPVISATTAIIGASFGVNYANVNKGQ